jgi:hypothetical protein
MEQPIIVNKESNGIYVFLAFIVTIAVVGFLVWRFVPLHKNSNSGTIDVNVSGQTSGGSTGGNGSGY